MANTFTMEDWEADETQSVTDNCSSWCTAHLWIVPARVEGSWKLPTGELLQYIAVPRDETTNCAFGGDD